MNFLRPASMVLHSEILVFLCIEKLFSLKNISFSWERFRVQKMTLIQQKNYFNVFCSGRFQRIRHLNTSMLVKFDC